MICASVCLLLPIPSSPESENHTQFCADPGEQVTCSCPYRPLLNPKIILTSVRIQGGRSELLRFWHGTPQLNSTPVVIWTMADEQREMCKLFGVERFVSKYEGPQALHSVLSAIIADEVSPASA